MAHGGNGSPLDPGLSQQGTPRLFVEDSQPEGADAEQAGLGLLAHGLPAWQSPSPVLEIVGGPAGSRAPAGGGAARERPAGEGWAVGGDRGRTNGAVLAGPMESAARPEAADPRGCVPEEEPPPGGESSALGKAGEGGEGDAEDCATSPCVEDTGMSQLQFGALELSQSQDFESDFVPNEGDARRQFHPGAAVPSSALVKNDTKDELHGDSTEPVSSRETHTALEGQPEKSERFLVVGRFRLQGKGEKWRER